MSPALDNLGWFYRGKMEQATGVPESLDHKIVYTMLVTFTVTGFVAMAFYAMQFIRLMLSLFVLPGKPVSSITSSVNVPGADRYPSCARLASPPKPGPL